MSSYNEGRRERFGKRNGFTGPVAETGMMMDYEKKRRLGVDAYLIAAGVGAVIGFLTGLVIRKLEKSVDGAE